MQDVIKKPTKTNDPKVYSIIIDGEKYIIEPEELEEPPS